MEGYFKMDYNFNFKKFSPIESMMVQIKEDGEKPTWEWIEGCESPYNRLYYRQLFFMAKKKLERNKQ